jgi:hypothetical protein
MEQTKKIITTKQLYLLNLFASRLYKLDHIITDAFLNNYHKFIFNNMKKYGYEIECLSMYKFSKLNYFDSKYVEVMKNLHYGIWTYNDRYVEIDRKNGIKTMTNIRLFHTNHHTPINLYSFLMLKFVKSESIKKKFWDLTKTFYINTEHNKLVNYSEKMDNIYYPPKICFNCYYYINGFCKDIQGHNKVCNNYVIR